ncbi:predicted protein [Lichtheimia corymbifera JMRC:FSU:9682]|uniref:Uncharacterized protein n=1 Tax=Lichtheimia corymbifera JMRC:FSU:9682 TaxID=1263082 RepID=A0A068S078_9FUNG|nr:predicted protein [Lichtheimia corymbifera JMRC:FSU:9682]
MLSRTLLRIQVTRPGAISVFNRTYTAVPTMPSSSVLGREHQAQDHGGHAQEHNPIQALYNKENESMFAHHVDHHFDQHSTQAPRSLSDDIHGSSDSFSPSFNTVFDE